MRLRSRVAMVMAWEEPAAAALMQFLAQELPYATDMAITKEKKATPPLNLNLSTPR